MNAEGLKNHNNRANKYLTIYLLHCLKSFLNFQTFSSDLMHSITVLKDTTTPSNNTHTLGRAKEPCFGIQKQKYFYHNAQNRKGFAQTSNVRNPNNYFLKWEEYKLCPPKTKPKTRNPLHHKIIWRFAYQRLVGLQTQN